MSDLPRSLYYFPWHPAGWLELTAALSPLARAAFVDLRSHAWTAPARHADPCTLPDDDAALARLARLELREWRKVAAEVRALLTPRPGGVLVDGPLLAIWTDQQAAYTRRANAGSSGGKARAEAKQRGSNATAMLQQQELEGVVPSAPSGAEREPSPAPGGALAPVGAAPRAPGAGRGDEPGDYLDRPGTRDHVARLGHRPGRGEPPPPSASDLAALEAERSAKDRAHFAAVRSAASAWRRANPAAYRALAAEQRQELLLPATGELTAAQTRVLTEAVIGRISEVNHWPAADAWDGLTPSVPAAVVTAE